MTVRTPPAASPSPAAGRAHPADATLRPLVKTLRGHVDAFAASMAPGRAHGDVEAARPAAVVWVYYSCLVAWAEDHRLIDPFVRADAAARRERYAAPAAGGTLGWLARSFGALCVHPSTWCLLDPRYTAVRDATPSEAACRDLVAWWSEQAPSFADADGERPAVEPASVTGWAVGDLLQEISDERRAGNALVQTPWFVCDLILDRTLVPAAATFRGTTLTAIDPCCGTGHFLIRMVDYLWELYTTGTLACRQARGGPHAKVTGWAPVGPAGAARRILEGIAGCEIDPLTAAVARLRVTVTIGDLLHRSGLLRGPLRLDTIPPWVAPRIAVGDSLLGGVVSATEYARVHPRLAAIVNLGIPDGIPGGEAGEPSGAGQLSLLGDVVS